MSTIQKFDYSINITQALLWQYDEAINLISLMTQKQTWYTANSSDFWESWFKNVFNLQTANLFGLCVWSIILDVPNYINTSDPDAKDSTTIWGFNDNSSYPTLENTYQNFNGIGTSSPSLTQIGGNFSSIGTRLILTEEEQRFILRLRYYQLISNGQINQINAFLQYLFSTSPAPFTGTAWVLDGLDMTMVYVFNFAIPSIMLFILQTLDLLPRPAGVGLRYVVTTIPVFGFNEVVDFPTYENSYQNFNNGNFFSVLNA